MHEIIHYPVYSIVCFVNMYPLKSDLLSILNNLFQVSDNLDPMFDQLCQEFKNKKQ